MKKKTIFWLIAIILIAVSVFFFVQSNTTKSKEITVRTGEIKKETIIEKLATTGTLIPNQTKSLIGTGNITELNVKVGDKVDKDKVLATYDNGLQLVAPFSGTITQVNIEANTTDTSAQLGKPSVQIDDLSTLKVQLQLSNSEALAVAVDQKTEIINDNKNYEGTIAEKDPVAISSQSATGSTANLGALVTFNQAPENLFAGFDVDIEVTTSTADNALALPIEALTYNEKNEPIVFVVKNGVAKEIKIDIGIQSDKLVEIKSGLKEDETVILSPSSDIKNNTEVTKE